MFVIYISLVIISKMGNGVSILCKLFSFFYDFFLLKGVGIVRKELKFLVGRDKGFILVVVFVRVFLILY